MWGYSLNTIVRSGSNTNQKAKRQHTNYSLKKPYRKKKPKKKQRQKSNRKTHENQPQMASVASDIAANKHTSPLELVYTIVHAPYVCVLCACCWHDAVCMLLCV